MEVAIRTPREHSFFLARSDKTNVACDYFSQSCRKGLSELFLFFPMRESNLTAAKHTFRHHEG